MENRKMNCHFTAYTVINFKCIKDLNVKYTFKRNVEEYLHVLGVGKEFIKQYTKIIIP